MVAIAQHRLLLLVVLSALLAVLPGVHWVTESRAGPQTSQTDFQRHLAEKQQSNERRLEVQDAGARLIGLPEATAFCNAWIDTTQPASPTVTVTVSRTAKTVRAATVSTTMTQTNIAFTTVSVVSTALSTVTATQTAVATALSTSTLSFTSPTVMATATVTSFPTTKTLGDGILLRRETSVPSPDHRYRQGREPKLHDARHSLRDHRKRSFAPRAIDVDADRKMSTKRKVTTTSIKHKATASSKHKATTSSKHKKVTTTAKPKKASSTKAKAKITPTPKAKGKTTSKTPTKHKIAKPFAFRLIPDDVLTDACLVVIYGFSAYPDTTVTTTKAVATRTVAAVTNTITEQFTLTLPTTTTVSVTQPVTTTMVVTSTLSITATQSTTIYTPSTTTKTVLATATAYNGKGYLKYDNGGFAAANLLDDSYLPRSPTLPGIKLGALNVRFEASTGKLYTPSGKVANIDLDEGFFAVYFDPPANLVSIGASPLICTVDGNTTELTCKAGTAGASKFYSCKTALLDLSPQVFLGGTTTTDPNCTPLKITFTP